MLSEVPEDIVLSILPELKRRDLKSLSEVSKQLHKIVSPTLYETITIVENEEGTGFVALQSLLQSKRYIALHTKAMHFKSCFGTENFRNRERRCMLSEAAGHDEGSVAHDAGLDRLVAFLMPLLMSVEDGRLKSFSWEPETCVPSQILGLSGYLSEKQKNIESIRLVTDSTCKFPANSHGGLFALRKVKSLSWHGLETPEQLQLLVRILRQNRHQVVNLELEFSKHNNFNIPRRTMSWKILEEAMNETSLDDLDLQQLIRGMNHPRVAAWSMYKKRFIDAIACDASHLPPYDRIPLFPALKMLSLSGISFLSGRQDAMTLLSFTTVRSLKLNMCPGWCLIFEQLSYQGYQVKLKSLEIVDSSYFGFPEVSLSRFLASFSGLEELLISATRNPNFVKLGRLRCCESNSPFLDVVNAIQYHKQTLTKFVYDVKEYSDLEQNRELPSQNLTGWMTDPFQNLLSQMDLEFLGISYTEMLALQTCGFNNATRCEYSQTDNIEMLLPRIFLLNLKLSLRVLQIRPFHPEREGMELPTFKAVRQNQEDILEFAQWAFGPDGISSLRIIAMGHVSSKAYSFEADKFLCRNDARKQSITVSIRNFRHYRYVTERDLCARNDIERYREALGFGLVEGLSQ